MSWDYSVLYSSVVLFYWNIQTVMWSHVIELNSPNSPENLKCTLLFLGDGEIKTNTEPPQLPAVVVVVHTHTHAIVKRKLCVPQAVVMRYTQFCQLTLHRKSTAAAGSFPSASNRRDGNFWNILRYKSRSSRTLSDSFLPSPLNSDACHATDANLEQKQEPTFFVFSFLGRITTLNVTLTG